MGIVKKQKNEIEGLKKRIEHLRAVANNKVMKAKRAETAMAAGEKMIAILIQKLGGVVKISDVEWNEQMTVVSKYNPETKETEFVLLEK